MQRYLEHNTRADGRQFMERRKIKIITSMKIINLGGRRNKEEKDKKKKENKEEEKEEGGGGRGEKGGGGGDGKVRDRGRNRRTSRREVANEKEDERKR